MTRFGVAGLQLRVDGTRSNLPYLEARLRELMHTFPWVEMVVFSELAAFGPSRKLAEPLPGPAEDTFREMAAAHRLWLVTGSLYEKDAGAIYNTASVIDPKGRVVGRHRKLFPFLPYEEGVEPGEDFLVFEVQGVGRFGVSICYDSWFPETSRMLAAMGAEVILHPSLTGTVDRDVELSIARATAATNQCFFVDINGLGAGGNGRSIVVGPDGDVLHEAGSGEELIPLRLDLERARRARAEGIRTLGQPLKSFRDRSVRLSVYNRQWKGGGYLETLGPLRKPRRPNRPAPPDHGSEGSDRGHEEDGRRPGRTGPQLEERDEAK